MSEQTLKRILGVLGVLVLLWIGSVLLSGRRSGGGSAPDGGMASVLERLNESTVTEIRIANADLTVSIQRSGDAWTVNGNVADSSAMTRLWSAITEAEVGGVAANNPRNHERLGVSADGARTVDFTLADGGTATVLVGNSGPITPSGFVRLPDQDAVVVVSGDLRSTLAQSVTEWRDKTVLRVDTAAVVRVVMETAAGTHIAERSDSTWSVDGEPAAAATMRLVLDELANLVAVGFVEGREAFQDNERRVIAVGEGQDTLGTVLITGEAGSRHARTPGSDIVFEVSGFRVDRITPDIERLRLTGGGA